LRTGQIDCAIIGNVIDVPDGIISEEIFTEKFICAVDRKNPILKSKITIDTYLSYPHLHIARDTVASGQVDIELEKIELKRNIMSVVPHYLVAPKIIRNTDLIATIGEGALYDFAEFNKLTLFNPPIALPEVTFAMLSDQRARFDAGNIWLRSLCNERADELKIEKQKLYKDNSELFE
jgi:DNA-binding transcriptional LysR family regulator